jgi:hypothetical protein
MHGNWFPPETLPVIADSITVFEMEHSTICFEKITNKRIIRILNFHHNRRYGWNGSHFVSYLLLFYCYAGKSMLHISNNETFKSIYFVYFHSLIKYSIIHLGGICKSMLHISNNETFKSIYIFNFNSLIKYSIIHLTGICIAKKIRLMMGVKSRTSCTDLFQWLQISTLPCEYMFSLIYFITNNKQQFQTNADVHSINTRHKHYIYNLSCFEKSAYYSGIKISNNLPSDLRSLINEKARFKIALKWYLYTHMHSTPLMNPYCLKSYSPI